MTLRVRKAIFPVGGLGTRFLPATKSMPKEMLPIVDKPLIQYVVEEAQAATVVKFGPLKPYFIEICPAGISEMSFGIKKGLNLGVPFPVPKLTHSL